MRKVLFLSLIICIAGCATISIPSYIKDTNPYKKEFYASFDDVLQATTVTLENLGWRISRKSDPSVFERNKIVNESAKQILILTDIRQTQMVVGTRYARVNVYLRSGANNTTEIEIRYLTVTSTTFKSFYDYKNDAEVDRLFRNIELNLGQ